MIRDYARRSSVRAAQYTGGNISELYQLSRGHALPRNLEVGNWIVSDGKVLGKGRAKLWRDGKIKVSDFTDENLRPLTLKELQRVAKN